jgi:hypothetical protein
VPGMLLWGSERSLLRGAFEGTLGARFCRLTELTIETRMPWGATATSCAGWWASGGCAV